MAWALLLTKSRTVWLAFFLSLIIFAVLTAKQFKFSFKILAASAAALLAIVLFAFFTNGFAVIGKRFYAIWSGQDTKYYSLIYRLELWQGCLAAILARPLGWGIGSFKFIFPQFRINEDRFLADYAHNEWLHLGVDFGILGILFAAGLIFLYVRAFWFLFHDPSVERKNKVLSAGFVAVLTALGIACLTDFPLRIYGSGLYFVFFLAMSGYLLRSSDEVRRHCYLTRPAAVPGAVSRWSRLGVTVGAALFALLAASQLMAEIHTDQGRRFESAFRWNESIAAYESAVRWSRRYAPHYEKLADLYRKKMTLSMDRKQRGEMRMAAIRFYEKALEYNPYVSTDHYFLALLYEDEGDSGQAAAAFRQAVSKDPRNSFYVLEAGRYALRRKDVKGAIEAFERFKSFKFREVPNSEPCALAKECMDLTSDYRELKRIIPDQWMYHQCFGMLLADRQQWPAAVLELDLALARGREGRQAEDFYKSIAVPIAEFYVSRNQFEEAIRVYRENPAGGGLDADREARIRDLAGRSNPKVISGVSP
jgi:tetratricopeptide (TPR) repeat protein